MTTGREDEDMSFTEDDVASDFVDAIDTMIGEDLGYRGCLDDYDWAGDGTENDGTWPFTVVRDGREFEVDIDVHVTEVTPERTAQREAEHERLRELIRAANERTRT